MWDIDTLDYVEKHELSKLIVGGNGNAGVIKSIEPSTKSPNEFRLNFPIPPVWGDLVRLHNCVIQRKVTTVMEFGCGYSTLVFAHALSLNYAANHKFIQRNMRRNNAFECHSVDDSKEFIEISKERVPNFLKRYVHFHHSPVVMDTFNDRICTLYETLPNICPDLIYLDGPSQSSVKGNVQGISTNHPDRLPMAADILRLEHFLLPGTLILVDGRTANARFLEANLQRKWHYEHHYDEDIHTFELREKPLGKYNEAQLRFCLGDDWLRWL